MHVENRVKAAHHPWFKCPPDMFLHVSYHTRKFTVFCSQSQVCESSRSFIILRKCWCLVSIAVWKNHSVYGKAKDRAVLSNTWSHWQGRPFTLDQILPVNIAPCPSSGTSYLKHLTEPLVTHRFVPMSQPGPLNIEIVVGVARQQADLGLP